ncbi:MAG: glutamate-5-semialdehyde dehydrogenase [Lentisphaerae bacterium]|nr:glutamate-5-semialdehyde dehydrogenase [Lentisphaerota bacterium]
MNAENITGDELRNALKQMGMKARQGALQLANVTAEAKNRWLSAMADSVEQNAPALLAANAVDMEKAAAKGTSGALLDRLKLTDQRIKAMADGLRHVVTLPDPVGEKLSVTTRPNGIRIEKVSVPIGVIGFIYESRPNVTVDAAGLCLKAGNAVILRGGSEAIRSNRAIADCILKAGLAEGMPEGAVQFIPWTAHEAVSEMLKLDAYINLIIPRGGERLIRAVVEQSTIPVIKHYKGVCHLYVDSEADQEMALKILRNGKCQRPGVCNALETLLVNEKIAAEFIPKVRTLCQAEGVTVHGDAAWRKFDPAAVEGKEEELYNEYLSLDISGRLVASAEAAAAHINQYGSGHSDSIITKNPATAEYFLSAVDSATVYWNASTRFTDGGEFGMGAEIGISTDKLHARGPMGLKELTSYKYRIYGEGQIR